MNLLNKINRETFYNQDIPLLYGEKNENANNHFALISFGDFKFKIAWHSDIEPVTKEIVSGIFYIGIDQNFSVINFNTGKVLLHLNLFFNFYDAKINNEYLYVITELEVIKINIVDMNIIDTYSLPDFFESIEFYKEKIIIKCVNDEVINR